MADTSLARACATLALVVACRSTAANEPTSAGPSCRDVATQGERVIGRASPSTRLGATRFYAEVIDLCQEPGLAQRARACLAQAGDLATARACPSLPATADTSTRDGDDEATPACGAVVAHAMRVLGREPDAPVPADDRAEEEQLFLRECTAASPSGRRCAMRALTADAIDECLALSDGESNADADADVD